MPKKGRRRDPKNATRKVRNRNFFCQVSEELRVLSDGAQEGTARCPRTTAWSCALSVDYASELELNKQEYPDFAKIESPDLDLTLTLRKTDTIPRRAQKGRRDHRIAFVDSPKIFLPCLIRTSSPSGRRQGLQTVFLRNSLPLPIGTQPNRTFAPRDPVIGIILYRRSSIKQLKARRVRR